MISTEGPLVIQADSSSQAVVEAIVALKQFGNETSPRGMKTKELLSTSIVIYEPTFWLGLPGRNLNDTIGVMEALQLVGQTSRPELMVHRVRNFGNFMDGGVFQGAYGVRAHGLLVAITDELRKDPDSRRAVLPIYDRRDVGFGGVDIPCTLSIQFFIRRNQLDMRVSMRSNDAWLGLPYDLMQFAFLQMAVATDLNLPVGTYVHTVGSLHLYEKDWNKEVLSIGGAQTLNPFSHLSIGDISSCCRRLLDHEAWDGMTPFERGLYNVLWGIG